MFCRLSLIFNPVQCGINLRLIAYLYEPSSGAVSAAATCTFDVYVVTQPNWDDAPIYTTSGSILPNSYFFSTINLSSIPLANLNGDSTIMIEATAVRFGITYRDRIYVNHLGCYESISKLKQDVTFLDFTKLDE